MNLGNELEVSIEKCKFGPFTIFPLIQVISEMIKDCLFFRNNNFEICFPKKNGKVNYKSEISISTIGVTQLYVRGDEILLTEQESHFLFYLSYYYLPV